MGILFIFFYYISLRCRLQLTVILSSLLFLDLLVRYPGLPEANNQCLWGIAHGISKSYKFFTYDVLENLQLRPKLLEFNRMTDETDYNKQADLLVGAYRRVNDMVQQTRTAEVKKIRALLKDKIAGGKGTGAGRPTIFFLLLLF